MSATAANVTTGELARGARLGKFVIVTKLGSGGMGTVYAAHDPELDRQVALKVLRAGSAADADDRARMVREGQAMARIVHANVITVYEAGSEGEVVYLAQELLDGGTLAEWIAHRPGQRAILERFVAAGRGLAAAHAAGLVHRDFKPDNVLLGKDGRVRVADFGLARALSSSEAALAATIKGGGDNGSGTPALDAHMTRTGAVLGTPMFMAPEQHRGDRADERSDQFAFCVALYHALYGSYPFAGKTVVALAQAVLDGAIEPAPEGTRVPGWLRSVLERGLANDPAQRFASMDELLAALADAPSSRRSWMVPALALAAVASVGGVTWWIVSQESARQEPTASLSEPTSAVTQGSAGPVANARAIDWLTVAIDRGELAQALEKFAIVVDHETKPGELAVARAGAAFVHVLRGEPAAAERELAQAGTGSGDRVAVGYLDMARSALALARGQLVAAREHAAACASAFATSVPALAAMCWELQGNAAADAGEVAAARDAYARGLTIARAHAAAPRVATIELALVQLELDENDRQQAASRVEVVVAAAIQREAHTVESLARLTLARIHTEAAATNAAFDELEVLELNGDGDSGNFRVAALRRLVEGYARGLGEDVESGLAALDQVRNDAAGRGLVAISLEARLLRVMVLAPIQDPRAAAEQRALIKDAERAGFRRVAKLARDVMQR